MMNSTSTKHLPKYRQVLEVLEQQIVAGRYLPGQKLPTEAVLVKETGTSRITVTRALRELQHRGLIRRRPGAGTFVTNGSASSAASKEVDLLFGLLIPNLGDGEIFESITQGLAEAVQAHKHALLWGHMMPGDEARENQTLEICQQYIAKKVAGVFFAPLGGTPDCDRANQGVASALQQAGIPTVLLDRPFVPYPKHSHHDLVSIDHRRAGYVVTEHLLQLGCRRIAFLAYAFSSSSVQARIAGYREATNSAGVFDTGLVQRLEGDPMTVVEQIMRTLKPDGIVCANDKAAAQVMRSLIAQNYRIPQDVRIVGIDDMEYAALLPIPLTTVRQPGRQIGAIAMAAMLERIALPSMPARDILLEFSLVIRDSCGSHLDATQTGANRASFVVKEFTEQRT